MTDDKMYQLFKIPSDVLRDTTPSNEQTAGFHIEILERSTRPAVLRHGFAQAGDVMVFDDTGGVCVVRIK